MPHEDACPAAPPPVSHPPHVPAIPQLLRVIDSLQLAAKFPVATPADWKQVSAAE